MEHQGYQPPLVQIGAAHQYTFQGQLKHEDFGLNWSQLKWRNHMPDLGRFFNIDPLSEKLSSYTPYNFVLNNPIIYVDPDGLFPIIIHVRSFVHTKDFAFGNNWAGDNRGITSDVNASSRLHQRTNYETETGIATHRANGTWSYSTFGAGAYSDAYVKDSGSSFGNIRTHLFGKNEALLPGGAAPLPPIPPDGGPSPDIDIHTDLNIDVSQLENGNQVLRITGDIIGDAFPDADALIEDANGNSVILRPFGTKASVQTGMLTELPGDNKRPMIMGIDISIITDSDGIFQSIRLGNNEESISISIDEWNSSFESMSVEEFRDNYQDWYNGLFD